MPIVRSKSSRKNISLSEGNILTAVRVIDIILDINHPLAQEKGNYDSIGTIFYHNLDDNDSTKNNKTASTASPLFPHLKYYPLINEIVLVLTTNDKNIYEGKQKSTYYLPQINMWKHPHHNALPSPLIKTLEQSENSYEEAESGLNNRGVNNEELKLGRYFKEKTNIKPLIPYEGDLILEGRFGNSIRFGSTNNSDNISNPNNWSDLGNTGDPITIIRNGQSNNLDEKGFIPTVENIGEDASNIYLTSNQRIRNFKQASQYMDSYNALYFEPQSLEDSILNPQPLPTSTGNPITDSPLPNKDLDLVGGRTLQEGTPTKPELNEVENNPSVTNESEDKIENQIVQKDIDITLPNSYVDPGNGGNGPGAGEEFETTN